MSAYVDVKHPYGDACSESPFGGIEGQVRGNWLWEWELPATEFWAREIWSTVRQVSRSLRSEAHLARGSFTG